MAIHFPKGAHPPHVETKPPVATSPPVVRTEKKPSDGMLPGAPAGVRERHTAPQGNSLIERTQRYLGQQLAKTEAALEPLVSQLQANGWFSADTLSAIGRAETKEQIADLVRHSPGAAALGTNVDLDRLSAELLTSPAKASSVLLLSSAGADIDRLGGGLAAPAQSALRELTNTTRHLDNLGTWVGKGYTQYTSLEQMQTELTAAQAAGVKQFFDAMAPVTLADVTAAQTAFQNAGRAGQGAVLDAFTQTMSRMPAKLWSELQGQGSDVRDRLENVLQRGPYGPEFEKARDVVSLFMTNGNEGTGLHAMFSKGIDLEFFLRGGYIPDTVGRGSELWT